MYNLSQAFFVMICLIAFSTCLPSTPDSRALSNHAHQPRSDDDLYTAADPHCSSGTTSKNKKRQITCPNPDAAKTKNVPPAEPDQRSDQHADPQPEPQGPAIPWRPRKDKYKGCDHHLLCGRGLRLDDQHQGLLVENLYLLNPGIPCQAIWCCLTYSKAHRQGKDCDRNGAYMLNPRVKDPDHKTSDAGTEPPDPNSSSEVSNAQTEPPDPNPVSEVSDALTGSPDPSSVLEVSDAQTGSPDSNSESVVSDAGFQVSDLDLGISS